MIRWVRGAILAVVFALVGAFAASLWLEISRESPTAFELPPGVWEGRRIRVEVLNGGGVPGLANQVTERLRDLRFDVVHYGNLDTFDTDSSVIIARTDAIEPARRVADALGLQRVVRQPDRNIYLDVTVVMGKDWAGGGETVGAQRAGPLAIWITRIKRAVARLWPG
jgi:hypothetical protein